MPPPPGSGMRRAPGRSFESGVLMLWIDDRHWGKLCFEYSPDRQPMIVSVVTRV